MEALQKAKRAHRRSLIRLQTHITEILSRTPTMTGAEHLEVYMIEFKGLKSKLEEVTQSELIELPIEGKAADVLEREENAICKDQEEVRSAYINLTIKVNDFRKVASPPPIQTLAPSRNSILSSTLSSDAYGPQIKKISVPEFDGDIRKFLSWKNLFETVVHNNDNFPPVTKLYHLKTALKNEAYDLIRDYELKDEAYIEAWNQIVSRYDNRRALIRTHFRDLLNIPSITCEGGLRDLLNKVDVIVRSLKVSGYKIGDAATDGMSPFLSYFISMKLDAQTRRDWELSVTDNTKYPSFEMLKPFLQQRCFSVEDRAMDAPSNTIKSHTADTSKQTDRRASKKGVVLNTVNNANCVVCAGQHRIIACEQFLAKNTYERLAIAKKHNLCINCLRDGHIFVECPSSNCRTCSKRHNTLLHHPSKGPTGTTPIADGNAPSAAKAALTAVSRGESSVLLTSAVVRVNIGRRCVLARVLLDNCSQPNVVTEQFVKKHRLRVQRGAGLPIESLGDRTLSRYIVSMSLMSRYDDDELRVDADVVPRIPYTSSKAFIERARVIFPGLNLAESEISHDGVDIIIGQSHFNRCMYDVPRRFVGDLCAHKSRFGWVISGLSASSSSSASVCFITTFSVEDQLREFWKVEEPVAVTDCSNQYANCEEHFAKTVTRELDGKFTVQLPFQANRSTIGESRTRALAALRRVERLTSPGTRQMYVEFMKEYEDLGHMEKVPPNSPEPSDVYYIPHRAVLKPTSSTTKLRVVFNASAKSSTAVSLNDILMVGPTIQPELFDTLVRFRVHRVAFCADVSKMYRCVNVHADDRDMQRILWRDHPGQPVAAYRLTTVTYGTAPASFLATKCLLTIADSIPNNPDAARAIRSDFYIDDLLTGAPSVSEAVALQQAVHSTLLTAHFPLRKYMSNSSDFLSTLEPTLLEKLSPLQLDSGGSVGILGLQWDPVGDRFCIALNLTDLSKIVDLTKRVILAEISRIFDPLGLVSPVTIRAKMMLQDLWREEKGWDDPVSEDLSSRFRDYYHDISRLALFSILRPYSNLSTIVRRQLVGFCDASEKAYCATIFLRTENNVGESCVRLVCAKTRVAPIKELTIPRLELQAAVLLAQLSHRVAVELSIEPVDVFAYSDSTIVLCWLHSSPEKWTTFVRNRVVKIRELGLRQWCYVNTKCNPADLATRGVSASGLLECRLWKFGPLFLENREPFTLYNPHSNLKSVPETCKKSISLNLVNTDNRMYNVVQHYSCLDKLINIIAYVLRFATKNREKTRAVSVTERTLALNAIIRIFQEISYSKEICTLRIGAQINKNSSLCSLSPFLCNDGLLRVGGRIRNAPVSFDRQHPVILCAKSFIVELLVRCVHERYYHVNRMFLVNYLSYRFWIVGGLTNVVKKVIRSCTTCIRFKAQTGQQIMGQLPAARVTISRPFSYVGVDFAGPFSCKCVDHRTTRFSKVYAAFFVYFATRGVHIEIVKSLTTEDFLACLSRFTARRGVLIVIHSDNATNFVGASNLILADNSQMLNRVAQERIQWKFIPPRTPHQGGLWEAAVRAAKYHLVRVTKGVTLNYEEYNTLFTKIEGVLNSRPLCYRSLPDQPGGVLTPAHFWIGSPLLNPDASSDQEVPEMSLPLTRRYSLVADRLNSFWTLWKKDYLNQLQIKTKWRSLCPNLAVNDVVLLKDDLSPPSVWKFGIVTTVHPDQQGQVRIVEVKSSGTIKRRAISSLVLLVPDDSSSARGSVVNGE